MRRSDTTKQFQGQVWSIGHDSVDPQFEQSPHLFGVVHCPDVYLDTSAVKRSNDAIRRDLEAAVPRWHLHRIDCHDGSRRDREKAELRQREDEGEPRSTGRAGYARDESNSLSAPCRRERRDQDAIGRLGGEHGAGYGCSRLRRLDVDVETGGREGTKSLEQSRHALARSEVDLLQLRGCQIGHGCVDSGNAVEPGIVRDHGDAVFRHVDVGLEVENAESPRRVERGECVLGNVEGEAAVRENPRDSGGEPPAGRVSPAAVSVHGRRTPDRFP